VPSRAVAQSKCSAGAGMRGREDEGTEEATVLGRRNQGSGRIASNFHPPAAEVDRGAERGTSFGHPAS